MGKLARKGVCVEGGGGGGVRQNQIRNFQTTTSGTRQQPLGKLYSLNKQNNNNNNYPEPSIL